MAAGEVTIPSRNIRCITSVVTPDAHYVSQTRRLVAILEAFRNDFRRITMDQRDGNGGEFSGSRSTTRGAPSPAISWGLIDGPVRRSRREGQLWVMSTNGW
jgi:hypothetical protein